MTRRRILLVGLALLISAAGYWWYVRRNAVPDPPSVDLSKTDAEIAEAVEKATARVRDNPKDGTAWGHLGMVLRAHDFDTASVQAFRTAEKLDATEYRWPYLQGLTLVLLDPDVGVECLRRAADRAPPRRTEPRLRLAEVLLERGKLDEAEQLAGAGDDPRASLVRARAAADRGDWAAVLERVAACGGEPACRKKAALLRGQALAAVGKGAEADAALKEAAALPDDPAWPDPVVEQVLQLKVGTIARLSHARQLLQAGRGWEAIEALREAVRRAPSDPEAALLLGQVLVRANDPAEGKAVLSALTARHPESVEGWFQLGVADFLLGNLAAAMDSFRKAIALKPDHAQAYFNLGHCYKKAGDKPAARAAFAEAFRLRPDLGGTRDAIAELDSGK